MVPQDHECPDSSYGNRVIIRGGYTFHFLRHILQKLYAKTEADPRAKMVMYVVGHGLCSLGTEGVV
jgi:hypothetical protein